MSIRQQFLRFATVGVANTLLDFLIFIALINLTSLSPIVANVISYSAGIANSFVWNKHWTFGDKEPTTTKQLVLFGIGNGAGLALSTATVALLIGFLGPFFAKVISVGVTLLWNYAFSRRIVFYSSDNTRWPKH